MSFYVLETDLWEDRWVAFFQAKQRWFGASEKVLCDLSEYPVPNANL